MRKILLAGLLMAVNALAGAQAPKYAFEVVSVKPFDSVENRVSIRTNLDTFEAQGVTLDDLVRFAYGMDFGDEVSGTPGELKGKRWTIRAKMDAETAEAFRKMKPAERDAPHQAMMLAMLEERFKLKAHTVTKDGSIFALVQAKGGAKLKETAKAADEERPKGPDGQTKGGRFMVSGSSMEGNDVPVAQLARVLQGQVQRKVVDETGLKGRYDFTLKWSREPGEGGKAAGEDENAPALETALEEQLGLKLESKRGAVESVVVDHAEMPTEN